MKKISYLNWSFRNRGIVTAASHFIFLSFYSIFIVYTFIFFFLCLVILLADLMVGTYLLNVILISHNFFLFYFSVRNGIVFSSWKFFG